MLSICGRAILRDNIEQLLDDGWGDLAWSRSIEGMEGASLPPRNICLFSIKNTVLMQAFGRISVICGAADRGFRATGGGNLPALPSWRETWLHNQNVYFRQSFIPAGVRAGMTDDL